MRVRTCQIRSGYINHHDMLVVIRNVNNHHDVFVVIRNDSNFVSNVERSVLI